LASPKKSQTKRRPPKKAKPSEPKKRGRTKYVPSEEHLHTAYVGAKKGLNYKEIAEAIGISDRTLRRNLDLFSPSIKKGRDESDDKNCEKVENALLKKATGFTFTEKTTEKRVDATGKAVIVKKDVEKYYAPSDLAIFFYLVNRMPGRWQSINRPPLDDGDGAGEIQQWFREMRKQYDSIKKS